MNTLQLLDNQKPDRNESWRVFALSGASVALSLVLLFGRQGVTAKLAGILGTTALAGVGLVDALKPDTKKRQRIIEREAQVTVAATIADACVYWAERNPVLAAQGLTAPPDFIDAYARAIVANENVFALPEATEQPFEIPVSFEQKTTFEQPAEIDRETPVNSEALSYDSVAFKPRQRDEKPQWLNQLVGYPSVMVFGAPGGGKTHFAEWVAQELLKRGATIKVLDPHCNPEKWPGCERVGGSLSYSAIDEEILDMVEEIRYRYGQYEKGVKNFPPLVYICEELTNWAARIEHVEELVNAIPDGRKVNVGLLWIAHTDKTTGLFKGKASGKAGMLENTLVKVQLYAKANPMTGDAEPTFTGQINICGQGWQPVKIPQLSIEKRRVATEKAFTPRSTEPARITVQKETVPGTTVYLKIPPLAEYLQKYADLRTIVKLCVSPKIDSPHALTLATLCERTQIEPALRDYDTIKLRDCLETLANSYGEIFKLDGTIFSVRNVTLLGESLEAQNTVS